MRSLTDFEAVVYNARTASAAYHEIDHATARVIGSLYHAGQNSVTYLFASTGMIADRTDVYREAFPDYATLSADEKFVAGMFGTYLGNRVDRTAVAGWSNLWV